MTLGHHGNYISFPTAGKEGGASGYVDSFVLDSDNNPIDAELDDSAVILDHNDSAILASANEKILDFNNEPILDSNGLAILDSGVATQTIFSTDNRISDGSV